jgi:UDP-glucose 4-epimerase
VLEVIDEYARASGREVPYQIKPRRPGDVAACYADPTLAHSLLGWTAQHDLAQMCRDSWHWQSTNPRGFQA